MLMDSVQEQLDKRHVKVKNNNMHVIYTPEAQIFVRFSLCLWVNLILVV